MDLDSESTEMGDEQFIRRLREKIERLTERSIDLRIDYDEANQLQVELEPEVPRIVLGSNIYKYAGFARMCVEYSVASIREQRPIDTLEFHLLLARN
ncbi:MAG: hypothetical protein ACE5Q6_17230 [Dehalococcoidia bacterium]